MNLVVQIYHLYYPTVLEVRNLTWFCLTELNFLLEDLGKKPVALLFQVLEGTLEKAMATCVRDSEHRASLSQPRLKHRGRRWSRN